MHAGRPGTVTQPPRHPSCLPDQPRPPPDYDHSRQGPGVRLVPGIERAQAGNEDLGIAAPVRMIRPDELPAAAPDLVSVNVSHLLDGGG
jgi:hypothetical protein